MLLSPVFSVKLMHLVPKTFLIFTSSFCKLLLEFETSFSYFDSL